jgi:gliding motility-associated-like protein
VTIHQPIVHAWSDTIVCPNEPAFLFAEGGVSYSWSPATYQLLQSDGSAIRVSVASSTHFVVTGYDQYSCTNTDTVLVDTYPLPHVQACPDIIATLDEVVQLTANSQTATTYIWSPTEFVSCNVCQNPTTAPNQPMTFTVIVYDENGCSATDEVKVTYDPLIYVPNTFTPNNDGKNEKFFALGINITGFQLEIYDRWGERIYVGDALSQMWDGTYKNKPCPDGVYTWKIEYGSLFTGERYRLVGHVTLLR